MLCKNKQVLIKKIIYFINRKQHRKERERTKSAIQIIHCISYLGMGRQVEFIKYIQWRLIIQNYLKHLKFEEVSSPYLNLLLMYISFVIHIAIV